MKKTLAMSAMFALLANTIPLPLLNGASAAANDEESCIAGGVEAVQNRVVKCKIERDVNANGELIGSIPSPSLPTRFVLYDSHSKSSTNLGYPSTQNHFITSTPFFKDYSNPANSWFVFKRSFIRDDSSAYSYVGFKKKIVVENGPKEYMLNFRGDDMLQVFVDGVQLTNFNVDNGVEWYKQFIMPIKLENGEHNIEFQLLNFNAPQNSGKFIGSSTSAFIDITGPYDAGSFFNPSGIKTWNEINNFMKTVNYEDKKLSNDFEVSANNSSIKICNNPDILGGLPESIHDKLKLDLVIKKCTYSYDLLPQGTITASENTATNNDVVLTLTTNIDIAAPAGWTKTAAKTYTQTVDSNQTVTANLLNGSKTGTATYNVTNITRPDIIENPTIAPSAKYYVKVEFLPGTNGTLNGTTLFYVLKNKTVSLTSPTVSPNEGYVFTDRNAPVATNFTADATYTAQYAEAPVTLTHSHASLTDGKILPATMPAIADLQTTYFTPTSPAQASFADVADADLDGVWKFQSWTPATITVKTASDPTTFTAQWAFTPNQHTVNYSFASQDPTQILPSEVTNLKPQSSMGVMGEVIMPATNFAPVVITDPTDPLKTGTWTFLARDQPSKTIQKSDLNFVGTWKFTPKPATVKYSFQSADAIPYLTTLDAYKPAEQVTTYGQTITPATPTKTAEKTSDGTWNWQGWTEATKQVTTDVITFVGKWLFDPAPTGTITGEPTQRTKDTITLTLTTNEDVQTPDGWTPVNNSKQKFTKNLDQNSTISVTVTDLGGNDSVQITATVDQIDKVAPTMLKLETKGKVALIKDAQVEIHFAGEDKKGTNPINDNSGIAKYQCQLNNGEWIDDCKAPLTIQDLIEGTNTIKVKAIDKAGNPSDPKEVTVVSDRTAPIITMKEGSLTLIHNVDTYKPANASCTDNIDTTCSVVQSGPDVPAEIAKLAGQQLTDPVKFIEVFTAKDNAGNKRQVQRTITIVPADFPVITLKGDPTVTQELGTPYVDAGATANDKQDGDITANIVTKNPVLDKLGSYTVTYDVTDKSNNPAPQVTRIVTVVDTTKPTITPVADQGFDEGKDITPIQITVTDNDPQATTTVTGLPTGLSFDPTTKQITGKSSETGIHTVVVISTDRSGNQSSTSFTLEFNDITPPVLSDHTDIRIRKNPQLDLIITGNDNHEIADISFDGLPVEMTVTIEKNSPKQRFAKISGAPNKGTYHLIGHIVDKAGNKGKDITFKIIAYAPNSNTGGGSSSSISTDHCPNGDHSGNLYDGKCDAITIQITTGASNTEENKQVITGSLQPEPQKDQNPELQKDQKSEHIDGKLKFSDGLIYNPTIINGQCYTRRPYLGIKDSETIVTAEEFKKALSFFRSYELTMFDSVDGFDPYRNLSREEAAKIFSNFAINVLCRKPDLNLKVNYSDVENADPTLKPYITLAYQLGVMKGSGMGDGLFRPFDHITKAEVNAVLMRMILKSYLDEAQSEVKTWYSEYNKVATDLGIINQGAGAQSVSRNDVALMLFRAYKNQAFDWRNINYFSYVLQSRELFVK